MAETTINDIFTISKNNQIINPDQITRNTDLKGATLDSFDMEVIKWNMQTLLVKYGASQELWSKISEWLTSLTNLLNNWNPNNAQIVTQLNKLNKLKYVWDRNKAHEFLVGLWLPGLVKLVEWNDSRSVDSTKKTVTTANSNFPTNTNPTKESNIKSWNSWAEKVMNPNPSRTAMLNDA